MSGRNYLVCITISASGPLHTREFEQKASTRPQELRPRQLSNLKFSTADADYLHDHWKLPGYDSGQDEQHIRLRNPTLKEFWTGLDDGVRWLLERREREDWCGGWLVLCFAGHGRPSTGAFCLSDGDVTAHDLMEVLAVLHDDQTPRRLKLSVLMDSCYSGAFACDLAELVLTQHDDRFFPYELWAAAMHDEVAMESESLGHGLFTYCFSVRTLHLTAYAATAVQPDNSLGPSLWFAKGPEGCRRVSGGSQNPVVFFPLGKPLVDGPGKSKELVEFPDYRSSTFRQELEQQRAAREGSWGESNVFSDHQGRQSEQGVALLFREFMDE